MIVACISNVHLFPKKTLYPTGVSVKNVNEDPENVLSTLVFLAIFSQKLPA
jgi:hypothetical protein